MDAKDLNELQAMHRYLLKHKVQLVHLHYTDLFDYSFNFADPGVIQSTALTNPASMTSRICPIVH